MKEPENNNSQIITKEDVNRLLEVGRLLLSVLTQEEIQQLSLAQNMQYISVEQLEEIGNAGVS